MKENPLPKNVFYDINKLPKDFGILVFPVSIARITKGQAPREILSFLKHFSPSKISDSKIGAHFLYGDYLYLHSKKPAESLRNNFAQLVIDHKNGVQNLVRKNRQEFQIQNAFSFQVWNDQYLRYEGDWYIKFLQFKKYALGDKKMVQYLKDDCKKWKLRYTEETLMFYLLSKGKLQILNEYIQDREQWILWAYPGAQPKSIIYAYQKNWFKLENQKNVYQNCVYDLEAKKLIDFTRIDLDTYNYSYEG